MSKYFKDCKTKKELKAKFKKLSKVYHPDNGGDVEVMKEINAEYSVLVEILPNDAEEPHATREEYKKEEYSVELSPALKEVLRKIATIPNIVVEVCGTWIWVSGDTYSVKERLKEVGFKFSGKKKMWYYREETEGCYRKHKSVDMGTIRMKYGSKNMNVKASCLA